MRRKIDAAAFLRRFDQEDAAWKRHALRLEGADGRQRAEDGVAVVRGTAPIKLPVAQYRLPGAESREPAGEFRLLVEMAVEKDRALELPRYIDEEDGRAAGKPADLDAHAGDGLRAAPVGHQLHCSVHVAVGLPGRVEHGRLVRDAHVIGETPDDGVAPGGADRGAQLLEIHGYLLLIIQYVTNTSQNPLDIYR